VLLPGLLCACLFVSPGYASPADVPFDPSGHWEGSIDIPGTPITVLVDLSRGDGSAWTGTIDIPLQGAKGVALAGIAVRGDSLLFALAGIPGDPRFAGAAREGRVEGTFTQGGQQFPFHLGREKMALPGRPQEPKPPFPYRSEEVTYLNGDIALAGTLTIPEGSGPFPAALLVTGSGPQNRDEELLGHKPFLVLSDHLTRAGIAVLRVDDRGVGGSSGSTMTSTSEDFAGDAIAGIRFLCGRQEVDPERVGIIGHSEGGLIGPLAASRSKEVAFVVMLAGTGVPGGDVILRQSEAIRRADGAEERSIAFELKLLRRSFELSAAGADSAAFRQALEETAAADLAALDDSPASQALRPKLEAIRDATLGAVHGIGTPWFRYFLTYDPRPALRGLRVPVLVLNGEKDLQVIADQNVPEIEKALQEAGNKDVTVRRFPGLNHLFQPAGSGSPAEYASIETTIDPPVLEAIISWIQSRFRSR
jgi:pimeloyl-ACP methyl ester carboxylesterase